MRQKATEGGVRLNLPWGFVTEGRGCRAHIKVPCEDRGKELYTVHHGFRHSSQHML